MASLKPLWLHVGSLCERLRCSESLVLGLDFDGTLTPILDQPEAVELSPRAREVIERLSRREGARLALLSGRALDDLRAKTGLGRAFFVGSAGLETLDEAGRREVHVGPDQSVPVELVRQLESWCQRFPGSWVERKPGSCALHYRVVTPGLQPAFGAGVRRRVRPFRGQARLVHGRAVFEVMPATGWDKAAALEAWLGSAPGVATLLFFGDDTEDESVHAMVRRRGGVAVAVGRIVSRAEYVLPSCDDVVWFLEWLDREWADRSGPARGPDAPAAARTEAATAVEAHAHL
ncbi:MAG: trehalose-phosphatase [Candidatus Eisenbacteria bacterium]|nr:trehalose-phosphatase [Candidatus Eisenbacteria bacterium]